MTDHDYHYTSPEKDRNNVAIGIPSPKKRKPDVFQEPKIQRKKSLIENKTKEKQIDFFQLPVGDILFRTNAGIFVTNSKDEVIWINDEILESPYFGSEIKAIYNKPVAEAIEYFREFAAHPRQYVQRMKELMTNKKVYYGEEISFKDGKLTYLDYVPIYHKNEFQGAIWQLIDHKDKPAENYPNYKRSSDESFLEMLNKFNIAFCEINMKGVIVACSSFFCKLIGYSEKDLLKISFIDLCRSGQQQIINCMKSHRSGLSAKTSFSFELEIILRDGGARWMQCHSSCKLDKDRRLIGGMLLLTEITEQKNIQEELKNARQVAERAQAAQQQFLASMSHDIRTPLNAIIGMTFLMEDTPLSKEQYEYVRVLKNASNILLGLLNGVLDFAKIESGKQEVHQREFDLPALLSTLIETITFKLNEKPVKFTSKIAPRIDHILLGDDILLNQILMNLLSNAEKFTAKGEINLDVQVVKEYENNIWIQFRIEDTGIGISKEKLKEIFHDFTQADEDTHLRYGGSGLGLFICKKLVEMLGGEIEVESTKGKGTSFTFSLPFASTNQLLKKSERTQARLQTFDTENIHILVVEDNPMNLKYLSSLLLKYKIPFDVATDGKYALQQAESQYYNLILMDMKLPKMNGMDVVKHIRENENPNTATPIVLVSAAALQSTVDKAREVGVNELLAKPYAPDQLVAILKKYLVEEEDIESDDNLSHYSFKFDERLDGAYLQKLYSGNASYALSLFDVFLECMDEDWQDIQEAMKEKDWQQLKNLVHKVKPNFSMVGLTFITVRMQNVYDKLKENDHATVTLLLEDVHHELDEYMPLIKKETKRLKQYTAQEVS